VKIEAIEFKEEPANKLAFGTPEEAMGRVLDHVNKLGASDLFIATNETDVSLSVRHLGIVRLLDRAPREMGVRWISYLKASSGIPLDTRFRPNEGRWLREHPDGRKTDLRINTIPTLYGEDVAIRLLDRDSSLRQLHNLGLMQPQFNSMLALVQAPGGLVLVTGPTSSGKTTTLYGCLQQINDGRRKINTIEDPIEYAVEGIRQSQVNPAQNVDFNDLLRSVLRQAPDVIMIGEIRDPITAQTAVRAANSGHLVFATLHAPTACAAMHSMLNLDVQPHFFASSLRGVIAQRLVRTLCTDCKVAYDLSAAPVTFAGLQKWLPQGQGTQFHSATGCPTCGFSRYSDRIGVFEVLTVTPALRDMILERRKSSDLERMAISEGFIPFHDSGLFKVAEGLTDPEELLRTVPTEILGTEGENSSSG
jgi:type II secretory ATPase GspE/PulE/Tfp pilus assembly ATPase PilB-like protein